MAVDKVRSSNGGLYRSRSSCKLQVAIVVVVCKVNHLVINNKVNHLESCHKQQRWINVVDEDGWSPE
jgi:hypothetical protein